MDKVRIGIIGAGYWGPNLIRNFTTLASAEVVAVADTKQDRLDNIQALYPQIRTTVNYRELFQMGLDGVVVATPPATHFRLAADCLDHGLNVLVEKPLALRTADAEELIELAADHNLVLMVGNTFEYNDAVLELKKIIDRGELGHIHYIDAVRTNLGLFQPHVNAMWDLAPHDISILLYLLGKDPLSVSAQGKSSIFSNIHDVVYIYLKFPDSALAHIHVSWLNPCKVRRITVVGSKKMAVYDDLENLEKIKIYDKGVDVPPHTDTFSDFQCGYRYGDVVTPYIKFGEPLRAECQHFVDSIANSTQPRSDGWVGLRIVKVLETASTSLQNDGRLCAISPTLKPAADGSQSSEKAAV